MFLVSALCSFAQRSDSSVVAEVFFGSGFGQNANSDCVTVMINDHLFYQDFCLYSVKSYGCALGEFVIAKRGKKLVARNRLGKGEEISIGKWKSKSLALEIVFHGKKIEYLIESEKGHYIVINNRNGDLEFIQLTQSPEFY